jgi:hypothetical protein
MQKKMAPVRGSEAGAGSSWQTNFQFRTRTMIVAQKGGV